MNACELPGIAIGADGLVIQKETKDVKSHTFEEYIYGGGINREMSKIYGMLEIASLRKILQRVESEY